MSSHGRDADSIAAARRDLHELTVLAAALLRLTTKVHARCEELRESLGDLAPLQEDEILGVFRPSSDGSEPPLPVAPSGSGDRSPAELLALSLAGEGMSREQIRDYLDSSYEIDDLDGMLDRVLPDL